MVSYKCKKCGWRKFRMNNKQDNKMFGIFKTKCSELPGKT